MKWIYRQRTIKSESFGYKPATTNVATAKRYFSIREVEYMILEPNGKIGVLKKPKLASPTIKVLSLKQKSVYLPISLISDGTVVKDNLKQAGFDENWLFKQI